MQFTHYGGEAALLAVDLVNATVTGAPFTPESLAPLLAAHGTDRRPLTAGEAAEVAEWSQRLRPCFGPQDPAGRRDAVNRLLTEAASKPYITVHDGHAPHLHYADPALGLVAHIRAITAAALAHVICFAGQNRLGRCARARCGLAFVDTSRNGRRAYCSVRCANNDAVARHRSRAGAP
ncbi:CGNR zinc finger domain-containing protein [Streptomyces sp. NPDC093085]|uniref:CGNR zinc finger domain-containing protein n=1 Tax=Streptomyces sp. NPDC093085 TaxID=3155068 RepID=UPI003422076B